MINMCTRIARHVTFGLYEIRIRLQTLRNASTYIVRFKKDPPSVMEHQFSLDLLHRCPFVIHR